jgi:hypothetical protein
MKIAERQLNRRQALVGAGLMGGGALAAILSAPTAAAGEGATGLEGAWLLKITNDNDGSTNLVMTLDTRGGGVAGVSNNAPSSGPPGFGAWVSTGDNEFNETFDLFQFSPSGGFTGTLRVRAQSSIDHTGDHRSGRARLEFQPNGAPDFFTVGTTHFTGSRIKTLPL